MIEENSWLERLAISFTDWAERYIPDAFIFALIATIVVFIMGWLVSGSSLPHVVNSWGKGFWQLIPFTMQMALIIITGYVLATSGLLMRFIQWLSKTPKTARGAVVLVALFAMLTSWFNWGFSLIFSAILAREIGRRYPNPKVDYRILGAASIIGLGSIWAQGLSGSAALQMCTASALPHYIRKIIEHKDVIPGGLISLRHTIFLMQSLLSVVIEIIVVCLVFYFITPTGDGIKSARSLGIELESAPIQNTKIRSAKVPAEWLENSPLLTIIIAGIGLSYLLQYFHQSKNILGAINLNTINLTFLMIGFLLHWTPGRFMQAVREATPAVWAVILQFPFYAGIAGIIVYTSLNEHIISFFVAISTHTIFPAIITLYSAILGVFVPSGGSKWVIEAPYVMGAAHQLHENLGWVVSNYDLGEALGNLIQPFWMLPALAILGLRARNIMGYTFLVFLVLLPIVLALVVGLNFTLHYPLS